MKRWVLIICLLTCLHVLAQKNSPKDFKTLISNADMHMASGELQEAFQLYSLAWQHKKSIDLALKVARCLFSLDRETKAIPYLEYVQKTDFRSVELARLSGISYHRAYRFQEAKHWLSLYQKNAELPEYQKEAQLLLTHVDHAIKQIPAVRDQLTVFNLGAQVNSPYDDYSPVLTADERRLYFTSRRHTNTGAERDETGRFYEDIYLTKRVDSSWTSAYNVGEIINTDQHDATAGISPNGDELFIYRPDDGGNIWVSKLFADKWTEPISMGDKINSPYWETSISTIPSEQIVFFTSNRKGGKGGKDIYWSKQNDKGEWQEPVLLSDEINTEWDEESPFIHPDGKTLYFSSQGHNSMGGFDIFKCQIDVTTGKIISPVVNLGYPISDVGDDVFFVWSADNKRAYFSSERDGGFGLKDLYWINLEQTVHTEILTSRFILKDEKSRKSIMGSIELIDTKDQSVQRQEKLSECSFVINRTHTYQLSVSAQGYCSKQFYTLGDSISDSIELYLKPNYRKVVFNVNDKDGSKLKATIRVRDRLQGDVFDINDEISRDGFQEIMLKEGVSYNVEIVLKGYMIHESELEIPPNPCLSPNDTNSIPVKKIIVLTDLEEGKKSELKEIYFASGKVSPLPESLKQIEVLSEFMKINPEVSLEVLAHTDEFGSAQFNLELSQKRADKIVQLLVEKGISPQRLMATGKGESEPVYKGANRQAQKKNRRVEFKIIKL